MPLLGQEDALRDIFEVFRRLPNAKFETIPPANNETPVHGVVVRGRWATSADLLEGLER